MEKNTVLAILLSIVVITGGMFVQTKFFMPEYSEEAPVQTEIATTDTNTTNTNNISTTEFTASNTAAGDYSYVSADKAWNSGLPGSFVAVKDQSSESTFVYQTGVFTITFDTKGASVSSIKLKNHTTEGNPVELVYKGNSDRNAFLMYAGDDKTNPIDANFNYSIQENKIVFTKTFAQVDSNGEASDTFDVIKTFTFGENDYLFQVDIEMANSINKALPLNYANNAYTLAYEPQIGPTFVDMPNNNYSYRRFSTKYDGSTKKKTLKVSDVMEIEDYVTWTALAGKYFSVIAIPDVTKYKITLTQDTNKDGLAQSNAMYYTRPSINGAFNKDTFRFYCGPQLVEDMKIYNKASDNGFNLSELNLDKAVDASSWLGWLESFLKWALTMLYKLIPNYGVAIILLTILLKLAINPLTKKSMQSTKKMSALGPQMEELKTKYKDNPDRLNKEMSALYKKESVSPISGCLPMLIQFPILIAFYGLLNRHFELRGAMFIPGWIPDLSQPDTVLNFGLSLPFIGSQLHLLPIFYTVSMIFSMKITQGAQGAAAGQTQTMMKMMTYGMPIMFFFVLYNAPSGLLLYWSVMNLISILQQVYTNKKPIKTKTKVKNVKVFSPSQKKKKK